MERGGGDAMVSVAAVAQYLEGLDFPATKKEILDYAEDRNAPPDVMEALQQMPEPIGGKYYSIASIWDAVVPSEEVRIHGGED
jgi:hypothetical protein